MSDQKTPPEDGLWQKTQFANLVRYIPSGIYFARFKVRGKLIRKSLKTGTLTVAKLRLADLEKAERRTAESQSNATQGKMTFGDALKIYRERIAGDVSLKQRSKDYYCERITALLKSWPSLERTDVRSLSSSDCLNWAASFGKTASPSSFNNTVKILRDTLAIAIECGARYDNPALSIKRAGVRAKKLQLPEFSKFGAFVEAMENAGARFSRSCANLARFLAYGGFRKSEAANIQWQDCDFEGKKITVFGDPESRTKNGEFRAVPMIPDMARLLGRLRLERPEAKPSDPVMLVRECQKAMDRAAKQIKIPRIIPFFSRNWRMTGPTMFLGGCMF